MGLRPNSDARYGLAANWSFHSFALSPFGPVATVEGAGDAVDTDVGVGSGDGIGGEGVGSGAGSSEERGGRHLHPSIQ